MLTALSNPSIRGALPLGRRDILQFDGLGKDALSITGDGTLTAAGRPVTQPIVFATGGTVMLPAQPARIVRDRYFTLVVPRGPVRLAGVAEGVRAEGKLAPTGRLTAYPATGAGYAAHRSSHAPAGLPADPALIPRRVRHRAGSPGARRLDRRVQVVSGRETPYLLTYRTIQVDGDAPGPFVSTVASALAATATVPCASA